MSVWNTSYEYRLRSYHKSRPCRPITVTIRVVLKDMRQVNTYEITRNIILVTRREELHV